MPKKQEQTKSGVTVETLKDFSIKLSERAHRLEDKTAQLNTLTFRLTSRLSQLEDEVARMKEHVGWINILGITTSLGFIFFFIVVAAGFI